MAALAIGAVVLGSGSSLVLGFIPFLVAVVCALVIGVGLELVRGAAPGALLLPGLALLVTAQLAYGVGLAAQVGLAHLTRKDQRRPGAAASGLAGDERLAHERKTIDPAHHQTR